MFASGGNAISAGKDQDPSLRSGRQFTRDGTLNLKAESKRYRFTMRISVPFFLNST